MAAQEARKNGSVIIEVPVGQVPEDNAILRRQANHGGHINFQASADQMATAVRILDSIRGQYLASGLVCSKPIHAMQWLLEQVAQQEGEAKGNSKPKAKGSKPAPSKP